MKLLVLLLLASTCLAQVAKPFEKANSVLVTFDTLSVKGGFLAAGRTLLDMGYTINKADPTFQTIETSPRGFSGSQSKASVSVIIRVSLKEDEKGHTEIKLSGVFGSTLESSPTTEIEFRGMKGSPFSVGFEKIQALASHLSAFGRSKISYALH